MKGLGTYRRLFSIIIIFGSNSRWGLPWDGHFEKNVDL